MTRKLHHLICLLPCLLLAPVSQTGCANLAMADATERVKLSYVCSGEDRDRCNYLLFSEGRRVSLILRLRQGQTRTLSDQPVTTRFCMSANEEPIPDPRTCRQFYFNGKPVPEHITI
ncbi:hypothetical protein [Chitinimonas naiadis]